MEHIRVEEEFSSYKYFKKCFKEYQDHFGVTYFKKNSTKVENSRVKIPKEIRKVAKYYEIYFACTGYVLRTFDWNFIDSLLCEHFRNDNKCSSRLTLRLFKKRVLKITAFARSHTCRSSNVKNFKTIMCLTYI